ncbi:MAG: DUF58 domain-containing protein [Bacteroidetes bacterium]|nr:MAG: DUF58 domain-containing protein [Bacteroidota bacterium]
MSFQSDQPIYKKYENLELLARQVVEGFITGLHKSPFHGFSVEFAEHRIYNPGESTKHIDWKLYGRTEKLFVKKFEEETNLRCQLVIDNSSSMYFPGYGKNDNSEVSKIDFSIQCAASLIYLLKKQRDAVGLSVFSENLAVHTPAKSSSVHNKLLFSNLENLSEPENKVLNRRSNPASVLHEIADKIHKRSLVIIFSDMMENTGEPNAVFDALQHLRHNKHEVILFHVFDKNKELDFDFQNRPYRFIDMETGGEMKLNPSQIKDTYRNAVEKFHSELRLKCMQYQIDFVASDIQAGFENVLLSFFRKRSKLY